MPRKRDKPADHVAELGKSLRALFPSGTIPAGIAEKVLPVAKELYAKHLAAAFEQAGLDPAQPLHRELMLCLLASAVFGSPPKGRPLKSGLAWDLDREVQLAIDYCKVGGGPDLAASKKIAELPEYKRANITDGTIRNRLPAARETLEWAKQGIRLARLNRP